MPLSVRTVANLLILACAVLPLRGTCHAGASYPGREEGSRWRVQALERIEKIRKADLAVEVVDASGRPLPGAQVKLVMQRHAFAFGSAVTAYDLTAREPDAHRYRELVRRNFNKVVLENDLKWGSWEQGDRQGTLEALRWLRAQGIEVRGHCVVWASLEGESGTRQYLALPPDQFRTTLLEHAREEVATVGSLVSEWDVVNHPLGFGKGYLAQRYGFPFYDEVFDLVSRSNTRAKRYINEGDILASTAYRRESYLELVSDMLARGAKVQGIGFMGHFKGDRTLEAPEMILETFDRYARLGLPLQVTEFDVSFGREMFSAYRLSEEQERLQADYLRDFLIAAYSHPAVEGVVMWGFWEGRHSFPDAALYRQDWSVKPNGKAWEELVLHRWWSREGGQTGPAGTFSARCFLGSYRIEVARGGKSAVVEGVEVKKPGTLVRVTLE